MHLRSAHLGNGRLSEAGGLPSTAAFPLARIARLRFTGTQRLTCLFHQPGQKGTFLLCLDILPQGI